MQSRTQFKYLGPMASSEGEKICLVMPRWWPELNCVGELASSIVALNDTPLLPTLM